MKTIHAKDGTTITLTGCVIHCSDGETYTLVGGTLVGPMGFTVHGVSGPEEALGAVAAMHGGRLA